MALDPADRLAVVPEPAKGRDVPPDYNARVDLFEGAPRTITVSVGDRVVHAFVADAAGRQQLRVPLPTAMLGQDETTQIQLTVNRTFVPANLVANSRDTRELGIQIYQAAIIPNP